MPTKKPTPMPPAQRREAQRQLAQLGKRQAPAKKGGKGK